MSTWNHRVLARKEYSEIHFSIHEVYYDEEGNPKSYTQECIGVGGGSISGIKWQLDMMQKCLEKPVLWYGDRFPKEYTKKCKNVREGSSCSKNNKCAFPDCD